MMQRLGSSDAAVLETFVVPRYLKLFGEAVLDMFICGESAGVAHIGCRTGYPDELLGERFHSGYITGLDSSQPAIELAKTKGALISGIQTDYEVFNGFPTRLPDAAYTHGVSLHPSVLVEDRRALIAEMARLIVPRGQILLALPLRGSFQEVIDLLREYALKHDAADIRNATDTATLVRPNVEELEQELSRAGFNNVDIDLRPASIEFQSGRDFLEDPIARLLVLPEIQSTLGLEDMAEPLRYVEEAINRYWSEDNFELTINVGCVSGRRVA
jgi:SAM-dependent methyltransferase